MIRMGASGNEGMKMGGRCEVDKTTTGDGKRTCE